MTTPITSVQPNAYAPQLAAAPSATGAAAASSGTNLLDPQAFLQLLVAQLQYQDPTNPVDTSSFMNQTAMLSQVQTMTSMSSTLTSLASAQQAQAATSLIGKQITYADSSGMQVKGVVDSASILATGATLHVGDTSVPLSSVLEVSQAPAAS
jgi:flagellar basal-body rod modification protein FlgD